MLGNQFTPDPSYTARYLARLQTRMAMAQPAKARDVTTADALVRKCEKLAPCARP